MDVGSGLRRPVGRRPIRSSSRAACSGRSSRPTCCSRSAMSRVRASTCRRRCSRASWSSPTLSRRVLMTVCGSRPSRPAAASTAGSTCSRGVRRRDAGRGTTNVDFGPGIRSALAGVEDRSSALSVGASAVEVETDGGSAVERRVPLPSRWLRGFLEVQAIQAELAPRGRARCRRDTSLPPVDPEVAIDAPSLARAGRPGPPYCSITTRARCRGPGWPCPSASLRTRRSARDRAPGVHGGDRRQHRLAARGARRPVDARAEPRGLAWLLGRRPRPASPGGRCVGGTIAAIRGALGWEPRLGVDALAATTGRTPAEVSAALASLALSGIVGYDLADGGYFRRELPFDLGRTERLQPRLRDARRLVEQGAVGIETGERRDRRMGQRCRWRRIPGPLDCRRLDLYLSVVWPPSW